MTPNGIVVMAVAAFCLTQVVPSTGASSASYFEEIIKNFVTKGEEILAEAVAAVEERMNLLANYTAQLDTVVVELGKMATIVAATLSEECNTTNIISLVSSVASAANSSASCVLLQYTAALGEVNATVVELAATATAATLAVETCEEESLLLAALCLAESVPTLIAKLATLTVTLATRYSELAALVAEWEVIVATCVSEAVTTFRTEALTVVNASITCIQSL